MDDKSKEILDEILKKAPDTLTPDEVKFLRARRDYLRKIDLEEFDSVINPKPPVKEEEPKKKGK